ncbi:MAG: divergent polysaccharide deacetylase family protein [Nitrospirae bacterium]|nr:divergent polysaccharide deacetylase family protein [Nitrospirota bacterium]
MPPKRKSSKSSRKSRHIILILLLIIAAVFLFIEESGRENIPESFFGMFRSGKKPEIAKHETRPAKALPKIAIVIDDLGPSRKLAEDVLNIKSPLTLSILPQQDYSAWIADEGKRRGRDVMIHIPMEASKPLRLGKGGLYTWMTDREIAETIEEDLRSVPYVKGANNHMGSAFTRDERAMNAMLSELKKRRLFFLDSLTSADSAGIRLANTLGLEAFHRDVFLDDSSDPVKIDVQWKRLMKIAKKNGRAIALAHPRKNTLEFLQKALRENKEVKVVPVTELSAD